MPERRLRAFHLLLAGATAGIAVLFATTPAAEWKTAAAPNDLGGLARHLAGHPTDAVAAANVTERALDAPVAQRLALWHAANDLARRLAPYRTYAQTAFARSGVFHWLELSDADRNDVLASIGPLLSDPSAFQELYKPVWELTGDLALLRRYAPHTENALSLLVTLAITNGRFDDYRALREEARAARDERLASERNAMPAAQLLQSLRPPFRTADEPAIVAALTELHRRPIDEDPHAAEALNALIDYAVAHKLEPLDGIEAVTRIPGSASDAQRARLALALDLPERAADIELATANDRAPEWRRYFVERAAFAERRGDPRGAAAYRTKALVAAAGEGTWSGVCGGSDICTSAHTQLDGPKSLAVEMVQSDEVPPYVELFVDDALVDEGPVAPRRTFTIRAGVHRVELQLANPMTRNRIQRRVRIV
jgi:hypothetical protein